MSLTEEAIESGELVDPLRDRPDLLLAPARELAERVLELEKIVQHQHRALVNVRQIAIHQVGIGDDDDE